MAAHKDKVAFVALFVTEFADANHSREECVAAASELLRLAKRKDAVNFALCNGCPGVERIPYPRAGVLIEEWEERIQRRKAKLVKRMRAVCEPFKLPVESGGDPRGAAIKVRFPSGTGNMIGARDWYAVPT